MIDLEQYKLIVEASPNMIWRANLETECDYFNKTWLDFTGRTTEQEYGFGWAEGVHPDDLDRCVSIYLSSFSKQESFEMDYRLKRFDGKYRWINDRGVPIYDKDDEFCGYIGSCIDITDNIEGQQFRHMAQYDMLCNIYTRQYAYQLLQESFRQSKEKDLPLTLLMIDIDSFKTINDRYGHSTGDTVLNFAAGIIRKEIRDTDILGRYGGDEFIVGLIQTGQTNAVEVANRIRAEIESSEITAGDLTNLKISFSIGVKTLQDEKILDDLVNNADKKLYEAKNEGKNKVKV